MYTVCIHTTWISLISCLSLNTFFPENMSSPSVTHGFWTLKIWAPNFFGNAAPTKWLCMATTSDSKRQSATMFRSQIADRRGPCQIWEFLSPIHKAWVQVWNVAQSIFMQTSAGKKDPVGSKLVFHKWRIVVICVISRKKCQRVPECKSHLSRHWAGT